MTITLLAPDGVEITATQYRQAQAATHGGGSGRRLGGRSGFRVDTPSSVLTVTSTTWTLGPCAAMIDAGRVTHQGMYGWSTDANITGSVDPANDTYARIDRISIEVLDDTAGDGTGEVSAYVVYTAGLPSATPQAPNYPGFLVGTINVPKLGGGSPTVQLNPARYAAAGAPLPVYSEAERDELDKFDGLIVQRRDLAGRPLQTWSTSSNAWHGQVWTSYTPDWGGWVNPGAGFVSTGSYMMIGPNLCTVRMKLRAGSTPNLGTGPLAVTLPFPSASDQATLGQGEWLGTGVNGGLQTVILSNPPSNSMASILAPPAGTAAAVSPGLAGYGYGTQTEVHCTITYRTA